MEIDSFLRVLPMWIPETCSVSPIPHSSSMQVFLTLTYTEHLFEFHQTSPARDEASPRYGLLLAGTTTLPPRRHSSQHLATCFSRGTCALTPILSGLGFSDPWEMRDLEEKIRADASDIIVAWVSRNGRRSVLPLEMEIVREREIVFTDQDLVDIAIRESRMESERNYGMVPTAKEALRLKCVKVGKEKKDDCTICLEELTDVAASMPCKHLFHGPCITTWLETSHYCPVCRYEMPTGR